MTDEEIKRGISDALGKNATVNRDWSGSRVEITITSYSGFSLNFGNLMKVAQVLGTLDFDINDEFEEGHRYSEYTKEPDMYLRRIVVQADKIGTGLPWEERKINEA